MQSLQSRYQVVAAPTIVHQLGKLDLAPPSPRTFRARHDDISVIEEKFELKLVVNNGTESPCDQQIHAALTHS